MTLEKMPCSRIVLGPESLWPTVHVKRLFLAAIIVVTLVTNHFARVNPCQLGVFSLKILNPAVGHVRNPTVLTPANRIRITTLRAGVQGLASSPFLSMNKANFAADAATSNASERRRLRSLFSAGILTSHHSSSNSSKITA